MVESDGNERYPILKIQLIQISACGVIVGEAKISGACGHLLQESGQLQSFGNECSAHGPVMRICLVDGLYFNVSSAYL